MDLIDFAEVAWRTEDIKGLMPDWNDERCAEFLRKYEQEIQEEMIAHVYGVIERLIAFEKEGVENADSMSV